MREFSSKRKCLRGGLKTTKNIFIKNRLKFYKLDKSLQKFNRYN